MSDLSIKTASEGVVNPPRTAVSAENKTVTSADSSASSGKGSKPDVSNYVTSPKGVVDPESGVYVLQYRDGATGEVLNQYPSEKAVSAYKRGAENGEAAVPPAAVSGTTSGTDQSATTSTAGSGPVTGGSVESAAVPAPSLGTVGTTLTGGQGLGATAPTSVDV